MCKMLIKERFKLFLRWDSVEYKNDSSAVLRNAVFTGPVLSEISEVVDNDSIKLDLSFQYVEALGSWSIAVLSWETVLSQTNEKVCLGDCVLTSPELTKTELLSKLDKLLIDTENHQEETHPFYLVYPAVMVDREGAVYKYKKGVR